MKIKGAWSQEALEELAKRIILSTQSEPYINDNNITSVSAHSSYKTTNQIRNAKEQAQEYAEELFAKAGKLTAELTNTEPTLDTTEENVLYYYSMTEDSQPPFRQYLKINSYTLLDLGTTEITLTGIIDNLDGEYESEKALSANMGYELDQKKLDIYQGDDNKGRVPVVGEDGNLEISDLEVEAVVRADERPVWYDSSKVVIIDNIDKTKGHQVKEKISLQLGKFGEMTQENIEECVKRDEKIIYDFCAKYDIKCEKRTTQHTIRPDLIVLDRIYEFTYDGDLTLYRTDGHNVMGSCTGVYLDYSIYSSTKEGYCWCVSYGDSGGQYREEGLIEVLRDYTKYDTETNVYAKDVELATKEYAKNHGGAQVYTKAEWDALETKPEPGTQVIISDDTSGGSGGGESGAIATVTKTLTVTFAEWLAQVTPTQLGVSDPTEYIWSVKSPHWEQVIYIDHVKSDFVQLRALEMSDSTGDAKTYLKKEGTITSVEFNGVQRNATTGGKDIYSTEETPTDKVWIDGKPIYRKVLSYPTVGSKDISTLSIDSIISFDFKSIDNGAIFFNGSIPTSTNTIKSNAYINKNKTTIGLEWEHSGYTLEKFEIIIEYTKK